MNSDEMLRSFWEATQRRNEAADAGDAEAEIQETETAFDHAAGLFDHLAQGGTPPDWTEGRN